MNTITSLSVHPLLWWVVSCLNDMSVWCTSRWFPVSLILKSWRWRRYITHTCQLTFNVLSGVIAQMTKQKLKQTPWPESTSKVYRPSDHRLSAKLVPTFADRGCHAISVMNTYGRILGFLDRSRYFFLQVAPQSHSRGWVNLGSDPPLLSKCISAWNRTRTSGSVARNSDH
jgi:hypothetical protein